MHTRDPPSQSTDIAASIVIRAVPVMRLISQLMVDFQNVA
jgi:hypothetical protein